MGGAFSFRFSWALSENEKEYGNENDFVLPPRAPGRYPGDNRRIVLFIAENEAEKLVGADVVLLEKSAVASAAVHERRGQFAAELGLGFRNQAGQPGDAVHGGGLVRQRRGVERDAGPAALLDV